MITPLIKQIAGRAVVVAETAWPAVAAGIASQGLQLAEVKTGPGQMRRYEVLCESPRVVLSLGLTARETQVLSGMASGLSNGDIGRSLFLTEDTVKTHARRLYKKLGARDRAHAVFLACQRGILGLDQEGAA